jgi:nicotinamide-nucleotide amidase
MRAELIVIGDEILSGRTADANIQFLGKFLRDQGLELGRATVVADDGAEIESTFAKAHKRSEAVIVSGGLGPTPDDKTKMCFTNFCGDELIERDDVAELVARHYERIEKKWQAGTNHYHHFPKNQKALHNGAGLAPGLAHIKKDRFLICLPGVPREFQAMLDEHLPELLKEIGHRASELERMAIRTFGIPEEKIFFDLCPNLWEELSAFGKVSSLPHFMGVDILVTPDHGFKAGQREEIKNIISESPIADHVWQYGELELPELVLTKAKEKSLSFAFAESCTGGLNGHRITSLAGSSEVFMGSMVTYSNQAKINALSVPVEIIEKHGAVSEQCAKAMAEGARTVSASDIAISTTGIAGPGGGSEEKPVGTICIGWATKDGSGAGTYRYYGDREKLKLRFSEKAYFTLLELLQKP